MYLNCKHRKKKLRKGESTSCLCNFLSFLPAQTIVQRIRLKTGSCIPAPQEPKHKFLASAGQKKSGSHANQFPRINQAHAFQIVFKLVYALYIKTCIRWMNVGKKIWAEVTAHAKADRKAWSGKIGSSLFTWYSEELTAMQGTLTIAVTVSTAPTLS